MNFTIDESFGMLLIQLVQEKLYTDMNPEGSVKLIMDALMGCSRELAMDVVIGRRVPVVDEASQSVILTDYDPVAHVDYPHTDPLSWISRGYGKISTESIEILQMIGSVNRLLTRQDVKVCINLTINDIKKIMDGDNGILSDDLEYDEDFTFISTCITEVEKFVGGAKKFLDVMQFLMKNFDGIDVGQASFMVQKIISIIKRVENSFEDLSDVHRSKSVKGRETTDLTLEEYVPEPVDILDGYDAGWLSPDGKFFGAMGEYSDMVHQKIAEALLRVGLLPLSDACTVNPFAYLEKNGWVKLHGRNVLYGGYLYDDARPITREQVDAIKKYGNVVCGGTLDFGMGMNTMSCARFGMMFEGNPFSMKTIFNLTEY